MSQGADARPSRVRRYLKRNRRPLLFLLALAISPLFVGAVFCINIAIFHRPEPWSQRRPKVEATIAQGDLIVEAIGAYVRDHARLPGVLEHLVPRYLKEVPKPALGEAFEYHGGSDTRWFQAKDDAQFEIVVSCPNGFINFDMLFYWSTEDYPKEIGSDNRVERIQRWAYMHE